MLKILEFFAGISLKKIVLLSIAITYYGFLFSLFVFSYKVTRDVYDLVFLIMNTATSGGSGSSELISNFFALLDCLGIISAFNAAKPYIVSSISALFSAIAYSFLSQYKDRLYRLVESLLS